MLPSWRFARRTLFARPGRSALLFVAIAMASTLVTAVGSGMHSVQKNVRGKLTNLLGEVDARLVQQSAAPFSAGIMDQIKSWPQVEAVSARRLGSLTLSRADGALDSAGKLRRTTAQARGIDPVSDPRFDPMPMQLGQRPSAPNHIALDPVTAKDLNAQIGDALLVLRLGEPVRLTVCGIVQRPMLGALQKPAVVLYRSTLNSAMGREDEQRRSRSCLHRQRMLARGAKPMRKMSNLTCCWSPRRWRHRVWTNRYSRGNLDSRWPR